MQIRLFLIFITIAREVYINFMIDLFPKIALILSAFLLAACTSSRPAKGYYEHPTIEDPSGTIWAIDSQTKRRLEVECWQFGGVNEASFKQISSQVWSYKCNNHPSLLKQKEQTKQVKSPSINLSGDINGSKQRCADLGFKAGTEEFGKCVLQLSR